MKTIVVMLVVLGIATHVAAQSQPSYFDWMSKDDAKKYQAARRVMDEAQQAREKGILELDQIGAQLSSLEAQMLAAFSSDDKRATNQVSKELKRLKGRIKKISEKGRKCDERFYKANATAKEILKKYTFLVSGPGWRV